MIRLDKMLMIGSAGANIGKTELACALIRRFGKGHNIVGIKVTTITDKNGQCPRGGEGCGVCSSLEGDFSITEEDGAATEAEKDTARLLAAGAGRVFWLRTVKTHLKEAAAALLEAVGRDAIIICESNSLRKVVEPGLFVIVESKGSRPWKESARDVREYADKIVGADGGRFDFDIERIVLSKDRWTIKEDATAIIMAGGDSRRMGIDKGMLLIKDTPIIEIICGQLCGCFEQILISANDTTKYTFCGCDVVPDKAAGQGPLMGIASALEASENELNFVTACDIPHIEMGIVRRMLTEAVGSGADIVVPTDDDGNYEPLFAVYRKSILGAINEVLASGGRRIADVFDRCEVKRIELKKGRIINLNTMEEYERFRKGYDAEIR